MRLGVNVLIGLIGFYLVTGFVHWQAWRSLGRVAPGFLARHRGRIKAAGFVLFALPTARLMTFVVPGVTTFAWLAAAGFLWHLTMFMSVAALSVFRAAAWLVAKVSRRGGGVDNVAPFNAEAGAATRETVSVAASAVDTVARETVSVAASAVDTVARETVGVAASAVDTVSGETVGVAASAVDTVSGASSRDIFAHRRQVLEGAIGAVTWAAAGSTLAWGTLRGRYEWAVEEIAIRLPKLPKALDGFTIVQISDLHVGTFIRERELATGLDVVRGVRPDLVAITGDIIDADVRYADLAASRLGALPARHGVVCVPGNHDHYAGVSGVLGAMRRAGIDVLLNRGKVVAPGDGGGFALLGVDDLSSRGGPAGSGPDLPLAQSMVPRDLATVLLAHQPRYAAFASRAGIDLQLSGHTHGGQINPGFRPIDLFFRYVAGRYVLGATQLYVNRGFGTVGPPTRVGAPPEITKIVLVAS